MGGELKEKSSLTPPQIRKGYDFQKRAREGDQKVLSEFDKSFSPSQKEDLAKGLAFNSAKEFRGYLLSLLQASEFRALKSGRK